MSTASSARAILDQEFLPVRAKILEIAASLDRLQRAGEEVSVDRRLKQLQAALELLLGDDEGRAERVQLLFSRPYDQQWRESFQRSR